MGEAPIQDNQPSDPDEVETAPEVTPVAPDEQELKRVAEPAVIRRAPKFGAFITAGVLIGAMIGLAVALIAGGLAGDQPGAEPGTAFVSIFEGDGAVRVVSMTGGAGFGALAAAGCALLADRRSTRGSGDRKRATPGRVGSGDVSP